MSRYIAYWESHAEPARTLWSSHADLLSAVRWAGRAPVITGPNGSLTRRWIERDGVVVDAAAELEAAGFIPIYRVLANESRGPLCDARPRGAP